MHFWNCIFSPILEQCDLPSWFHEIFSKYIKIILLFLKSFSDNVTLNIDGILYLVVKDPYKASYGVEDPEFAISQLAQTTMRSEIGKKPCL